MSKRVSSQNYPRINDEEDKYCGFLDIKELPVHKNKIDIKTLNKVIINGIHYASKKSSREILSIPPDITDSELDSIYKKKGKELFAYFTKYCGDPASSAYDCLNKHFHVIAKESFRNRTIQKERMNAGWRYQYIAKEAARLSNRFESVSDINSKEADFNVITSYENTHGQLNIYVSIKNRSNTMGGQDWPKAIRALEDAAKSDKNRAGYYICVFGIAMEKGERIIKTENSSGMPYSHNTEVWFSDFFWPFFSNYSYPEIATAVLNVLLKNGDASSFDTEVPASLIEAFGEQCIKHNLLDSNGYFNDAFKLVELFCGKK